MDKVTRKTAVQFPITEKNLDMLQTSIWATLPKDYQGLWENPSKSKEWLRSMLTALAHLR